MKKSEFPMMENEKSIVQFSFVQLKEDNMLGPTCELFETVYECQRLVEKFYKLWLIDSREVTGLSVGFIGDHGVGYSL